MRSTLPNGLVILTGEDRDDHLIHSGLYTPSQVEDLRKIEQGLSTYLAKNITGEEHMNFGVSAEDHSKGSIFIAPYCWIRDSFISIRDWYRRLN